MLILTNTASQEIAPGQILIFDLTRLHTGKCECYRNGSGSVGLRAQNAIYEINFSANIGAPVAGVAELSIVANGSPLTETTMMSTTATAGDLNNVSTTTAIRTCCCSSEFVTVMNTGTTTVTVDNPSLFIKLTA